MNQFTHNLVAPFQYVSHPDYNRRNGRSDMAILYLERNVEFTSKIAPICLPHTANLRQKSYIALQRSCGTRSINGDPVVGTHLRSILPLSILAKLCPAPPT